MKKDRKLYAIMKIFDSEIEKEKETDPHFYDNPNKPEGKHLVYASGAFYDPIEIEILRKVCDKLRSPYWKPKKWYQFWRKY